LVAQTGVKEKLVYARPLGVYWNWEGDFEV